VCTLLPLLPLPLLLLLPLLVLLLRLGSPTGLGLAGLVAAAMRCCWLVLLGLSFS
jgi:hypothetical protein